MATEIILPYPHAGQQYVRRHERRINWLVAGRRWRKTTLYMAIATEAAMMGQTVLWGAPVYDQVRIGWDESRRASGGVADFNQSRMTAVFPTGGKIVYRSLDDPDNVRGFTADGMVVDEAPTVKRWAWYEVLRPILMDTAGWAWLGGTPKGMNWFFDEWQKADLGVTQNSSAFQAPTLGVEITSSGLKRKPHPLENPEISFEEIQALYDSMPLAVFKQEILAEFVDSGDAVFDSSLVSAMADGWEGLQEPVGGQKYLTAWDIGRRRDATVGVTVDFSNEPYQVVAYDRMVGVPYPQIQKVIEARHLAYGGKTFIESNGVGDPVIENLNIRAIPFVTSARSKVDAITALQFIVEAQALKADIPQITHELRGYRWEDRELVQDSVMALGIAAKHLPKPGRPRVTPKPMDEALARRSRTETVGLTREVW